MKTYLNINEPYNKKYDKIIKQIAKEPLGRKRVFKNELLSECIDRDTERKDKIKADTFKNLSEPKIRDKILYDLFKRSTKILGDMYYLNAEKYINNTKILKLLGEEKEDKIYLLIDGANLVKSVDFVVAIYNLYETDKEFQKFDQFGYIKKYMHDYFKSRNIKMTFTKPIKYNIEIINHAPIGSQFHKIKHNKVEQIPIPRELENYFISQSFEYIIHKLNNSNKKENKSYFGIISMNQYKYGLSRKTGMKYLNDRLMISGTNVINLYSSCFILTDPRIRDTIGKYLGKTGETIECQHVFPRKNETDDMVLIILYKKVKIASISFPLSCEFF